MLKILLNDNLNFDMSQTVSDDRKHDKLYCHRKDISYRKHDNCHAVKV